MPRNDDRTRKDLEILGLETSASEDDKKKAFIKLALKLHPDRFTKNPDDVTKMKFHEVCKAYKRLTCDHSNTSDWNIDKSDEIFFSLLADSLQHNSKAALYELFSELPNHKSHFQNDNEYRIKEDVFDEEDEDTEFNRLIKILMNRLQNGKSLPAGLTQDKICKLKEDFMKQREASKRSIEDEKISIVTKKAKPQMQVPVTKPKPKSKKQILAEQRRREKEMAKIAEELDEKKKREGEKESARKQLEWEKQKKLEEEQRKLEEDRKRLAQETKKKKEREDREREQRQQKENERLEKLKKQQEEEAKRKEEEKKRKAEEKAAKSKAAKEARERDEKEKQEQAKKQQNNKRNQGQFQPQYSSQYQQQQQKYPREVPPRFLRQMQQRQQPTSNSQPDYDDAQQQSSTISNKKDQKSTVEDTIRDKDSNETIKTGEKTQGSLIAWSESSTVGHESWGQELSNSAGSLSDWGTVNATEDWDAPTTDSNFTDWNESVTTTGTSRQDIAKKSDPKIEASIVGTIGSEVKSGKIPKKENTAVDNRVPVNGQFGAIGQPVLSSSSTEGLESNASQRAILLTDKPEDPEPRTSGNDTGSDSINKNVNSRELMYKDAIERNRVAPVAGQSRSGVVGGEKFDMKSNMDKVSRKTEASSPKLTGWSGLDGFDATPIDSTINLKTASKNESDGSAEIGPSVKPESTVSSKDTAKSQVTATPSQQTSKDVTHYDKAVLNKTAEIKTDAPKAVNETANRETDEWGWVTASSKKTKQKSAVQSTTNKDQNVWTSRALKQLLDMGFNREDAEKALKENNGIIESAVSDLLSRTDVDRKQSQNQNAMSNEHASDVLSEMARQSKNQNMDKQDHVANSSAVASSPDKLNRKQRRKQIQAKSVTDDLKVNPVMKEPSLEVKSSTASHVAVDQGPNVPETSSDAVANKAGYVKDAGHTHQDASMAKPKSVGVIGGQLPSTSASRQGVSQSSPVTANTQSVSKDILGSLKINADTVDTAQTIPQSSNQHPLSQRRQLGVASTNVLGNAPSLHQGKLPGFPAEAQQANPAQTSRMQYILQQQLAQMRVGTPSNQAPAPIDSLLQQRQRFTPPLISSENQLPGTITNSQAPLTDQVFAPASLPASMPSTAPQVSKLRQWTQLRETTTVATPGVATESQQEQGARPWNGPASSSEVSSSVTSAVVSGSAPAMSSVTVDPVSAKWGVLAAPRLSPTPCEFKPGVPWKPKAELERGDRKPSGDDIDKDDSKADDEDVETRPPGLIKEPSKAIVRPPPGLNTANAFQPSTKDLEPKLDPQRPDLSMPPAMESRLLSLKNLNPKVDHQSLHGVCQKFGIVLNYAVVAPDSVLVRFENGMQAQTACKSLNGDYRFDSNIVAELILEEDRPISSDMKPIHPQQQQQQQKPFLPSPYPVQNFWDSNGQIGHMNPVLNPNMALAPGHPVGGLPPSGVLGMNPQLVPWVGGRTEPVVNSSNFWPNNFLNAPPQPSQQGLLSQVSGYGQWPGSTNSQPLTATNMTTYAAVSPSASAKLLPDGLFNGSESM
eukprot:gene9044-10011_t